MPVIKSLTKTSAFATFVAEWFALLRAKVENIKSYFFFIHQSRELQDTVIELTRQNALKDRLLTIVSHDIRSPLDSLKSLVSLILSEDISQEELRQLVLSLNGQVDQLSTFLENILKWTKSRSTELNPRFDQFNLLPLVAESVALHHLQAKKKRVSIEASVSEKIIVCVDEEMIKLVLRNLISNAIKFSYPDSTIHIRAREHYDRVMITVQDTGLGMSEENIRLLFSPSHLSTRGTKDEIGTGIGLALCQEFIKKMGGEIRVSSAAGIGSCFEVFVHAPAVHGSKPVSNSWKRTNSAT